MGRPKLQDRTRQVSVWMRPNERGYWDVQASPLHGGVRISGPANRVGIVLASFSNDPNISPDAREQENRQAFGYCTRHMRPLLEVDDGYFWCEGCGAETKQAVRLARRR